MNNKKEELYWELFNKTGYIGAYLMYNQSRKCEELKNEFPEASNLR